MGNSPKKIAFHTLGCKLNFSETSSISRVFSENGYSQVDFVDEADYYVINSCSVTAKAEKKCRALIRQALKRNPNAEIAVIGCFSQINSGKLKSIPGVSLVLGNAEKFNLFEHIGKINTPSESPDDNAADDLSTFVPSYSMDDRTRSFFKIQDGCDYFCSYCTVPLARGRSRSNTIETTIRVAEKIAGQKMKEVVLTGVNIGDFGKRHGESLFELLKRLVDVDGIERIRISSIEPDLLSDEIIELVAENKKLMPHFHIPLQSGNNQVLKDMGRRYSLELFQSRIDKILTLMPDACIAVDLIVGFPSETEEYFQSSLSFIEQTEISYVHVFTYSERDNTAALKISHKIPGIEKNLRSKKMHLLSEAKKKLFYENNFNKKAKVLWEKENINGFMFGFTENYIKVKTKYNPELVNKITDVLLNNIDTEGVYEV